MLRRALLPPTARQADQYEQANEDDDGVLIRFLNFIFLTGQREGSSQSLSGANACVNGELVMSLGGAAPRVASVYCAIGLREVARATSVISSR